MRKYLSPYVKLVNPSENPDIWYLIWLKSRASIIRNKDNSELDIFSINRISELPEEFYVGDELVNREIYRLRISKMNLQYMNFPYYVFEIQGSCLFRDLLFNINRIAQWATSNRFLF